MPIFFYVLLCLLAGVLGSETKLGFWGFFFLSLFTTPVVGLVVVVMGSSNRKERT